HADQTRWQLGKERQYLFASQLAGDDDHALGIDAVDLEYLLCKIEPDGGNCCHGRPPLVIRHQRPFNASPCLLGRRPPHHIRRQRRVHSAIMRGHYPYYGGTQFLIMENVEDRIAPRNISRRDNAVGKLPIMLYTCAILPACRAILRSVAPLEEL